MSFLHIILSICLFIFLFSSNLNNNLDDSLIKKKNEFIYSNCWIKMAKHILLHLKLIMSQLRMLANTKWLQKMNWAKAMQQSAWISTVSTSLNIFRFYWFTKYTYMFRDLSTFIQFAPYFQCNFRSYFHFGYL